MMDYSRNITYIENDLQARIKKEHILICGAGLGSNISECLVRTGFNRLTIYDYDKVELSNINRQNYVISDIGNSKVDSILNRLKAISPKGEFTVFNTKVNNKTDIPDDCNFVINCIDNDENDVSENFTVRALKNNKTVITPFNLGYNAMINILTPDMEKNEMNRMIHHIYNKNINILGEFILLYVPEERKKKIEIIIKNIYDKNINYYPQMSAGSNKVAAEVCCSVLDLIQNIKRENIKVI